MPVGIGLVQIGRRLVSSKGSKPHIIISEEESARAFEMSSVGFRADPKLRKF